MTLEGKLLTVSISAWFKSDQTDASFKLITIKYSNKREERIDIKSSAIAC
jgi:hypothetical protein